MVRGGGGVGRGVIRGLVQIQEQRVQVAPIQISDDSSETSDDSEEGEVDYSGFGRCFRCGELGSDHSSPTYIYIFIQVNLATGSGTAHIRIRKVNN